MTATLPVTCPVCRDVLDMPVVMHWVTADDGSTSVTVETTEDSDLLARTHAWTHS